MSLAKSRYSHDVRMQEAREGQVVYTIKTLMENKAALESSELHFVPKTVNKTSKVTF